MIRLLRERDVYKRQRESRAGAATGLTGEMTTQRLGSSPVEAEVTPSIWEMAEWIIRRSYGFIGSRVVLLPVRLSLIHI